MTLATYLRHLIESALAVPAACLFTTAVAVDGLTPTHRTILAAIGLLGLLTVGGTRPLLLPFGLLAGELATIAAGAGDTWRGPILAFGLLLVPLVALATAALDDGVPTSPTGTPARRVVATLRLVGAAVTVAALGVAFSGGALIDAVAAGGVTSRLAVTTVVVIAVVAAFRALPEHPNRELWHVWLLAWIACGALAGHVVPIAPAVGPAVLAGLAFALALSLLWLLGALILRRLRADG